MARGETIKEDRLKKREALVKAGLELYPSASKRSHTAAQVIEDFESLAKDNQEVWLVGRLRAIRAHGKATFLDVEDATGKLQWFVGADKIGAEVYDLINSGFDEGDFIQAGGTLFITKKGEKSLAVKEIKILAKSLQPLPNDWFGLKDKETRFRKRYVDLAINPEIRAAFVLRSHLISALRMHMEKAGFLEVETPILQSLSGGALARPFKTHLNALDIDLYLRVAPELYLKRLLVGGFERVYELGRNFRNEGMDASHNPEFTMLEFYWAYQDREGLMTFTEKMLTALVAELLGKPECEVEGQKIIFNKPWARINFTDLLKEKAGLDYDALDLKALTVKAEALGVAVEPGLGKGKIADEIFKKKCRPSIVQPTFVIDHPVEISPLAKKKPGDPSRTLRFQLVIAGNEYVNAYSELNDPIDQAERFKEQAAEAKRGDTETQPFDEDYIEALEYGMPPAAGWGLGVDRFTALLTGLPTLRENILFPFMRPK